MIIIGKLDKRVELKARVQTAEDTGSGAIYDYVTQKTVWAEFVSNRFNSTVLLGDGEGGILARQILIRAGVTVKKGWRAAWNGHTFDVKDVDDTVPGQLTLTVQEIEL